MKFDIIIRIMHCCSEFSAIHSKSDEQKLCSIYDENELFFIFEIVFPYILIHIHIHNPFVTL